MRKSRLILLAALAGLLAGCISVGDLVWVDQNANGIQDPGESGLEGVTVTLFDGNGNQLAQTTTNAAGGYTLQTQSSKAPSYYLAFSPPTGYSFTLKDQGSNDAVDSDVNPATGRTDLFTNQGDTTGNDAGLVPSASAGQEQSGGDATPEPDKASIGDFVWRDENANGIQDSGETGFEAVQVALYDADGNQLATTSTDANGNYQFDDVVTGLDYYLVFTPPENYELTNADQGGDDSLDSDADPTTDQTPTFTLAQAGSPDVDAGLILPVSAAANFCYGPGADDYPEGVSPLTGLEVSDPTFLSLNPVFLSVSIFPPKVRPPTGLAVAPTIYQLYIGDGDTRLLAAFYGEFPEPSYEGGGEGDQESGPPQLEEGQYLIGDRVWFDSNGNALQDDGEPGVAAVPVSLLDINFNVVQKTTTDGLGFYSFLLDDVQPNTEYQVRFGAPPSISDYYWVTKDVGSDDTVDSDATGLGRTDFFDPTDEADNVILHVDAGLRQAYRIEGLRSGRVAYQDIQVNYCGCIVSAGADPTVAAQIRTCANAFSDDPNNIGGAGLDVTRLQAIAENSTEHSSCRPNFDQAALICSQAPGEGGQPAQELYVQYNINNISHFVYDEGAGAYLWYLSVPGSADPAAFSLDDVEFELMTDRLTGEALTFENVVVMDVNHVAENAAVTIIGLDMAYKSGKAFEFRNGQMYEVNWSTTYPEYVTNRDQPLPVHFEMGGQPFPMAPGQTWINLLNQADTMDMIGSGIWLADFDAPSYSP